MQSGILPVCLTRSLLKSGLWRAWLFSHPKHNSRFLVDVSSWFVLGELFGVRKRLFECWFFKKHSKNTFRSFRANSCCAHLMATFESNRKLWTRTYVNIFINIHELSKLFSIDLPTAKTSHRPSATSNCLPIYLQYKQPIFGLISC